MLRRLQIRAPGDYVRHRRAHAEEKEQVLLSMRKGGKVGVNNTYEKLFKSITDVLTKLSNMIVYLAEHTMSVKDYKEFIDKFAEKPCDNEVFDFIKQRREEK